MRKLAAGVLAHVDAGKTTLSEAMLYVGGVIRRLGRVDKKDAFFDTDELEKMRGITIFSKQAILRWDNVELTLLDTPGHVDFSAEMERTLQVMDYAILVVSGTAGIQEHTRTLWRLLSCYGVPVFLFINKMDLSNISKGDLLEELRDAFKESFVDFEEAGSEAFYEQIAMTEEETLDAYLKTGTVGEDEIRKLIAKRRLFPCFFGSALKLSGVEEFMAGFSRYTVSPFYPEAFGARVFKITRDGQGNRLAHMKITGGSLRTKEIIAGEKVNEIRLYSGEKYEAVKEALAGTICAVTGLAGALAGNGLGEEAARFMPFMEPVMTYQLLLPEGTDAAWALSRLLQLEEEDPQLHIAWDEAKKEIHVQIMGQVQMEILKSLIKERFGLETEFGSRSIRYRETIENTVEGVGHFEPLRHYAEVHLLMEPGTRGSGLQYESACSGDILSRSWQRLVLTHLAEKEHKGVLTGSPITDMKITLVSGRAHLKHTEGGDFRQAVYRAVRQGLMQARCALLEPYYDFHLEIPERLVGRAMSDVERMAGTSAPPLVGDGRAVLTGTVPAASMDGYQQEVSAYSGGAGRLSLTFAGYGPCRDEEAVICANGYDPDTDEENPSGSVFCKHGAGFPVKWDEVFSYMQIQESKMASGGRKEGDDGDTGGREAGQTDEAWLGTDEVDDILERTFYANSQRSGADSRAGWRKRKPVPSSSVVRNFSEGSQGAGGLWTEGKNRNKEKRDDEKLYRKRSDQEYLLVDGYNIIYAWEELRELADGNIDGARGRLLDILCNYQAMKRLRVIVVFDAYRVEGHAAEWFDYHNIQVVFTKEAETADAYIERFAHENGRKYCVSVATSDRLEQIIIQGQGCRLVSARELYEELEELKETLRQDYEDRHPGEGRKSYLLDSVSEETLRQMKALSDE